MLHLGLEAGPVGLALDDEVVGLVGEAVDGALVAARLEQSPYLLGEVFTVADVYLFTVLSWSKHLALDLSRWPSLPAYLERIAARPSVQAALQAEAAAR